MQRWPRTELWFILEGGTTRSWLSRPGWPAQEQRRQLAQGGRCHGQLPSLHGHWIGHERVRGRIPGPLRIWVSILVTSAQESKRVPLSRLASLINLAPNQAPLKGGGEDKRAAHLFSLDSNPEIIRWLLQDLKQIKFERAERAALNSWLC